MIWKRSIGWWLRWGALAVGGIVLLVLLGRTGSRYFPALTTWVAGLGPWAPLALIALYTVGTVALVPGSFLTLAAGALFGLVQGTLFAFLGATLGAVAAFLVSRYLARGSVERRLRRDPRFQRIDRAIGQRGLRVVFLLRLSPVLPFTLLNYALGLTHVRLRDYALASVGMLPGTLLYVYNGKVVGELAALGAGTSMPRGPGYYLFLLLGLLATVAATIYVTRLARRALRDETNKGVVASAG